jgi:UDP-N-acetyl-D-glucosamine dehydrogenase
MNENLNDLETKIAQKKSIVCIIGLGYVGLPLVKSFLHAGFPVIGFDIDEKKVKSLNKGESYIRHVSGDDLLPFLKKDQLRISSDPNILQEADAVLICVPTPLDENRDPDLSFVLNTTEVISQNMRKGQLVVLESTTYPGTTEEKMMPILEKSGLKVGKDFFLAYSPERENPGDMKFSTTKIPKVLGGVTSGCQKAAKVLYDQVVVKTIPVSSTRVAEATKLLENIFRSVNIAMVNELKMIFDRMDIDIWEVIEAASSKPFGYMPFYPGPGFGGHCIPVDPFYLTWKAKEVDYETRFIELAGEINTTMPHYVLSKTSDALRDRGKKIASSKILILGISYKKDVDDQRESPSLKLIDLFQKKGADVSYHDPYSPKTTEYRAYPDLNMASIELNEKQLNGLDAVIIATDHSCYDYEWIAENSALVVDTRNAIKTKRENVVKA